MIPKIIHYCWFGGNPLPEAALKCINSWKKFFPDYEIKEWNESNFDVNAIPYTRDAYAARKYAFVSDYARFYILYNEGGLYFDTDVEVIKPMDDIIARGAFMGCETESYILKNRTSEVEGKAVNPGLGLGVAPGLGLYKRMLERFESLSFYKDDGSIQDYTMIPIISEMLFDSGLKNTNEIQCVENVWVYPRDYFNPLDDATGKLNVTENTRSIHWYMASWQPAQSEWKKKLKQYIRRIIRILHR